MTKRYVDGGDVDLDAEVVRRKDGTRLTEADAEAWAEEIKLRVGRPSLSSGHKHSPQVSARLPESLLERLRRRAEAEGKPASEIVREALEHYV
jgi:predicted DNA binding CopG/RHH family protein